MRVAILALVAGGIGCTPAGRPAPSPASAPASPPSAATPAAGHAAHAIAPADTAARSAELAAGKRVAETVCIACHTEQRPPKLAPPLTMVAMHYRQALASEDSVAVRIAAWLAAPSAARSLLPAHAIERFGLMPPLPLPDADRRAVARYVASLSAGHAGGMRHGPPGQHRMP